MTNPFLEELQQKGSYNPGNTGNPFIDEAYPHAGKDYDSIPWALGKSALGGFVGIVTGPAHWLKKVEDQYPNDPAKVFSMIAEIGDRLEPNLDPNSGFPTKAAVFASGMGGGLITGSMEFKGIAGALDMAATKFGGNAAVRATKAITEVAEGITLKARQIGLSEPIANTVGHAVRNLPRNLATGLTMDAINNPNQSAQGVATNSALIAGLSLMEGALYRKIPPRLIPNIVDDPLPVSQEQVVTQIPGDEYANKIMYKGKPAVKSDGGKIYSGWNKEHGDLTERAETYDDATFKRPDHEVSGWMYEGKFISVGDLEPYLRGQPYIPPKVSNSNDPDYLQRIQSKIGGIPPKTSNLMSPDDIYFQVVNRGRPFENLEKVAKKAGMEIPAAQSPTEMSRLSNGVGPMIKQFINQPMTLENDTLTPMPQMDETGKPMPGLKQAFANVGDDPDKMQKLDAYILAKSITTKPNLGTYREKYIHSQTKDVANVISADADNHYIDYPDRVATHPDLASAQGELQANGYKKVSSSNMPNPNKVPTGISIKDALQTISYIDENYPDVAEAHGMLMQHPQALRNFAASTNLLSDRAQRVYDLLQHDNVSFQSLLDGRLVSPTYSVIENTGSIIKAGVNNLVKDRILNLAEQNPAAVEDWVKAEKIPDAKQTPMWQQVNKVIDGLKERGLDYSDNREGILELVTKMGPHFSTPVDNNWSTIYSYKNGYLQRFSVNKDLSDALQAINPAHINLFTRLLGLPARGLSIGTVENPIFGLVHAIRDSYNATLNSKFGFRLGVDSWRGLKEAMGKGEYGGSMNAERLAAGGGYSTLVDARALLSDKDITNSVLPKTTGDQVLNRAIHPIQLLADMTRPFLEAARIGEYMKAREAGVTAFEAAMHSRSFIGDFGMKGASPVVQNLAYMTAFMNPGMQSLDAEIKAISNHPIGYAAKGIASIGLFTALNYANNYLQGDDDISQLRQTPEGSTYWYTKLPGGKILKTPKPFAPGQLFGTLLETALDKVRKQNPDGFTQWAKSLGEAAEFSVVPTSFMTATNLYANRDNFSGRPIIPSNLEGIDPQYQQTPSTSNVSKAITNTVRGATLGKVNISPITMDYILRSSLGTAGQAVEASSGNLGGIKKEVSEFPGLSRFVAKYPTYAAQPIEEFYSNAKDMDEIVRTANHLYKTNQIDAFTKYVTENANKWALAPVYSETKAQINELRTALISVENDSYISGKTKEEMRDYILKQTISITDNVNKSLRKILD